MSERADETLEERVERLERLVEQLQREAAARPSPAPAPALASPAIAASTVDRGSTGRHGSTVDSPPAPDRQTPIDRRVLPEAHPGRPRSAARGLVPRIDWDGQLWLNRLGIALVLLGVALLFRYSIEQGWLTPAVRVGFGAALGVVLFAAGLKLDGNRRFGEVLLGGGVATFYIVGWAAFHLYGLIGYTAAFVGMVAITVLAFTMALGRDAMWLAVLGAAGGLGTPLILGVSYGSPRGFALYTSLVLAWAAGVQLRRGWKWLLWTAISLGWVLLFVYARHLAPEARYVPVDRWAVQAAALFAWAVLGVLPLAQRVRAHLAHPHERHWREREAVHWYALALVPPLGVLAVAAPVWNPQPEPWGLATLAVAAGYGAAAWALYSRDPRIARALLFTVSVLLSVGSIAAFGGDALLLALAAQGLGLHWLAGKGGGPAVRWMAHKVFIAAGLWMLVRLLETDTDAARALSDLAVVACALLISFLLRRRRTVMAYRYFAHVALLGWLWRELAPLGGGQGIATIAWCAYGLALLLLALRRGWPMLEKTAVLTLLVVVAKLFLVDLAALDALFRVLLFLGFGSAFLVLSYSLQGWWKNVRPDGDSHAPSVR